MKKRTLTLLTILALSLSLTACGKDEPASDTSAADTTNTDQNVVADVDVAPATEEPTTEESHEGMYRSELTNEWIDESLKDQRPIAVMVDNESIALPHYGLTQADIVYEMMNSTANGKITRLMALVKDWDSLTQFGSIRSARPTNLVLAAEWNAVLVHDGGPVYCNPYFEEAYTNNLSGGFSRVNNGKAREYTEYVCEGDLDKQFASHKYSTTYNEYYEGPHLQFADESNPVDLSSFASVKDADEIALPFPHNKSKLTYNADDQLYYYSEYGEKHLDPANDNAQLSFKNVILQSCPYIQYDEHGYMMFYIINTNQEGYYITDGKAIKITWAKTSATGPTNYFDENGNKITLNTGKTYIGIVPDEDWSKLSIE